MNACWNRMRVHAARCYDGGVARVAWVVLTMGDRPAELHRAISSLLAQRTPSNIIVFANGADVGEVEASIPINSNVLVLGSDENLGAPGGRVAALAHLDNDIELLGFLDDDGEVLRSDLNDCLVAEFEEPDVAVVAMRLVDESSATNRRHVPRPGRRSAAVAGDVPFFLAGAVAMRRSAYELAGGYWAELIYAHEEIDLAWRIIDAGGRIVYRPDLTVFHPRTLISRHARGWWQTGRNRVAVARRNLPISILVVHILIWLAVGTIRAPSGCRWAYVSGWLAGWRFDVQRRPISYRTVMRLCGLGRLPVI